MARSNPAAGDPETIETAEATTPPVAEDVAAQVHEWGQYVASEDIRVGLALAYAKGDPVPAANVALHGYDEAGLVEKVN